MKVGDLVKYVDLDEICAPGIGVIVDGDETEWEILFHDGEVACFGPDCLQVINESR